MNFHSVCVINSIFETAISFEYIFSFFFFPMSTIYLHMSVLSLKNAKDTSVGKSLKVLNCGVFRLDDGISGR